MKLKLFTIITLLMYCMAKAQVTLIPDQNFEQTLINQNIDSDGIINGQVFTNNINTLTTLTTGSLIINDLTGLEDFAQLQDLTINKLDVFNTNNQTLDLTNNTMLETLFMNGQDDANAVIVNDIDLSENPNINQIHTIGIWALKTLDLKSGTTDVSNLSINIDVGFPLPPSEGQASSTQQQDFCIKVSDKDAATAGTGVYSTWTISANNNPYYFSETCTLNTKRFNQESVSIYPNPTRDIIHIKANNIDFNTIKIFNLQGQIIKTFNKLDTKSLDVSGLASGMYVVRLASDDGIIIRKIVKQ